MKKILAVTLFLSIIGINSTYAIESNTVLRAGTEENIQKKHLSKNKTG